MAWLVLESKEQCRASTKRRWHHGALSWGWRVALAALLWLLLAGGCHRTWQAPASQTSCDPWSQDALGVALDGDLNSAATTDERAGWIGCLVLSEQDGTARAQVARLHKDGAIMTWRGDGFQETVSLPSSGRSDVAFRFQLYGLRYPVIDLLDQSNGRPSTSSALFQRLGKEACPQLKADSYQTCLKASGMCRFAIEFRPTPPRGTAPPSTLSPASDGISRVTAGDTCALYTATPSQESTPEPAPEGEPDGSTELLAEAGPEPAPEPTPEPTLDTGPVPACAQPCLWSRKATITMQDNRDRVKGIEQIARNASGTQFVASYERFSMRFQGSAANGGYNVVKTLVFHGDFRPARAYFDGKGQRVARVRELNNSDGHRFQVSTFANLFESFSHDRNIVRGSGLLGGGFLFDNSAFLVFMSSGFLTIWRSGSGFQRNETPTPIESNSPGISAFAIHPGSPYWAQAVYDSPAKQTGLSVYEQTGNSPSSAIQTGTLAGSVAAMAYHPDGTHIIAAGLEDGKPKLQVLLSNLKVEQILTPGLSPRPAAYHKIFFSPGKEVMATLEQPEGATTELRAIRLWRRIPKQAGENYNRYIDFTFFALRSDGTPKLNPIGDATFGDDCHTIIVGHNTLRDQINAWRCE